MAEAITYAELRFVKAPLKKSISTWQEEDSEAYEDGELTYENVQVPSAPEWPVDLAPSGLGDKAEVQSEQPPASCSLVTSAAAGRVLPCCAAYTHYLLAGLLLTCLLLGVTAICLGVHYLRVSQHLQQMDRDLEATNSSLHQQLHRQTSQLGQRTEELQGSRKELAQSQKTLQVEQEHRQAAEEQLQICQSQREKTEETLRRKEVQQDSLEQRLNSMQATLRDKVKPFFVCSLSVCCPVGWIQKRNRCFYFSSIRRSWEDSRKHCKDMSSDLVRWRQTYQYTYEYSGEIREIKDICKQQLSPHDYSGSCWVGLSFNKTWQWIDGTPFQGSSWTRNLKCAKLQCNKHRQDLQPEDCSDDLPSICEMAAFRLPEEDHFLHL